MVRRRLLDWPSYEPTEDDGLDDLSDEEEVSLGGIPLVAALGEGATLARRCRCPTPLFDGGDSCSRCGRPLAQLAA